MSQVIRLCLDLNIWCAALLANLKNRQDTSCQIIVNLVKKRKTPQGQIQLIISWGMLNRLKKVLEQDLKVSSTTAQNYIDTIYEYANFHPHITLGGTGIIPLADTEDAHVLETCLAGNAELLITANFKDFITKDTEIIINERHAIYRSPKININIVHPFLMAQWLNLEQIPLIKNKP